MEKSIKLVKKKVETAIVEAKPTKHEKKPFIYAIGKRKTASARVRLYAKDARGDLIVNDKDYKRRFPYFEYQQIIEQPLKKVNLFGKHYITVRVIGGGIRSQAEAVRHGISRALLRLDESFKKSLRSEGFLTRDPREKERKKPGLKRARRAPQFAKR